MTSALPTRADPLIRPATLIQHRGRRVYYTPRYGRLYTYRFPDERSVDKRHQSQQIVSSRGSVPSEINVHSTKKQSVATPSPHSCNVEFCCLGGAGECIRRDTSRVRNKRTLPSKSTPCVRTNIALMGCGVHQVGGLMILTECTLISIGTGRELVFPPETQQFWFPT